jgi:Ca2+-transporting ATPase
MGISPGALLLLPLHVVLLELVIDPTCSIVLERQPAEKDIMDRAPRNPEENILTSKTLIKSIMQGFTIFAAEFGTYIVFLKQNPDNAELARAMGITIILLANILLVQVNSSNSELAIHSFKKLVKDKVMWAVSVGTIVGLIVILYTPLCNFLKLAPLCLNQMFIAILAAFGSVGWYELVKVFNRGQTPLISI